MTSTEIKDIRVINVEGLPDGCVGRAIFWNATGPIEAQPVIDALTQAGFADEEVGIVPNTPSGTVALRRAMEAVSRQHSAPGQPPFYVRPLGGGGKGKKNKLGWLIAQQRDDSQVAAGTSAATVDLVVHTECTVVDGTEQISFTFDPPDHPYRSEIEAKYTYYLTHLNGDDISYFLTQTVARSKIFGMVPLRPSGGFYYVSPQIVPLWDVFTEAFAKSSGTRFHHINVLNTEKSMVEAALAGITEMFSKRIADLNEELAKEPGMRKLRNATDEIADILQTAASHESVLGGVLTDLREQADRVGHTLRMMLAKAEAERITAENS